MLNEAEQKRKKAHKQKLLAMLALLLAPVVISYALHYSDYRPGTMNYGELIDMEDFEGSAVNQVDNTKQETIVGTRYASSEVTYGGK